ncbi:tRNA glutamyl-Q(34) synthetase GluQRS [Pacificimonas sp. WHA3]|uniref:tRNA glutamyl-Q(34) synthetase GluQRS n=1 Tax=Pacificimonas pallii TaxID=2827236 RepID=A0ABS6SAY6_9SPHN|nr:tRNA glutamyl-Q(34) synthetase GluQRS [Pacificimonas pallii]MBV7255569.1 tRNA glutamyl-Q(34) synthetase GluQRS [Pacificimonas pallii]
MMTSRFAPSPTGLLHLGHAYSAILAHDMARRAGGRFLLRIEDLDQGRARGEYVEAIFEDLTWLGLTWDEAPLRQSRRGEVYRDALDRLIALDAAYPCFCTRRDIAQAADAPQGPDGPLYPGTCRLLPPAVRRARMATDAHAWRLDMDAAARLAGPLTFEDHGRSIAVDPLLNGDVVIARKDAGSSYHLAATIDDAACGVTDVVRGTDLLASTHVHRVLQALLGLDAPRYHHHGLVAGDDGERLAKRNGARPLAALRDDGVTAADIRARFALSS